MLDFVQSCERANLDSLLCLANSFELFYPANIQNVLRLEELLPHGWKQVGAAGENTDISRVIAQMGQRVGQSARAGQSEFGKTHCPPLAGDGARPT